MLTSEVARRCEQKVGLGEFPLVRRRLFRRLQRTCEHFGDGALLIVAEVLEEVDGPKIGNKGKYFCYAVVRRLKEAGLWEFDGSSRPPGPGAAEVKAKVVQSTALPVDPLSPPAAKATFSQEYRQRFAERERQEREAEAKRMGEL